MAKVATAIVVVTVIVDMVTVALVMVLTTRLITTGVIVATAGMESYLFVMKAKEGYPFLKLFQFV